MNDVNVRGTMNRLPAFLQPLLTWLTGRARHGQRALVPSTPLGQLATGLAGLVLGVGEAARVAASPSRASLLLLPLCWILTVGSARKLHVTICHQCVHLRFSGNPWIDRKVAQTLSALLLVQDFDGYYHDHRELHHGLELATLDDPDLKFLIVLGFSPGMSRRALWRRLAMTLVSPYFHGLFLGYRLRTNFVSCPPFRRALAWVLQGGVATLLLAMSGATGLVIAWLFPLTFLYHSSSLLQFLGEHRWLQVRPPGASNKLHLARLTSGRFVGEPAPPAGLGASRAALAWSWWAFKMATYHLACRCFVLVGDLPVHDWHHRHPSSRDWPNALYSRQRDLDLGCPHWPEPYTEVWGLHRAIDATFALWSTLGGADYDRRPMPRAEQELVVRGM